TSSTSLPVSMYRCPTIIPPPCMLYSAGAGSSSPLGDRTVSSMSGAPDGPGTVYSAISTGRCPTTSAGGKNMLVIDRRISGSSSGVIAGPGSPIPSSATAISGSNGTGTVLIDSSSRGTWLWAFRIDTIAVRPERFHETTQLRGADTGNQIQRPEVLFELLQTTGADERRHVRRVGQGERDGELRRRGVEFLGDLGESRNCGCDLLANRPRIAADHPLRRFTGENAAFQYGGGLHADTVVEEFGERLPVRNGPSCHAVLQLCDLRGGYTTFSRDPTQRVDISCRPVVDLPDSDQPLL